MEVLECFFRVSGDSVLTNDINLGEKRSKNKEMRSRKIISNIKKISLSFLVSIGVNGL